MRVAVLGDDMIIRRLSASLARQGIEVVGTATAAKGKHFDLAVVDSLEEEVEAACHYIKQVFGMPVVLMVRARQADWERLELVDTDAYVPEDVGGAELAARLRAVVRRHSAKKSAGRGKGRGAIGGNQL